MSEKIWKFFYHIILENVDLKLGRFVPILFSLNFATYVVNKPYYVCSMGRVGCGSGSFVLVRYPLWCTMSVFFDIVIEGALYIVFPTEPFTLFFFFILKPFTLYLLYTTYILTYIIWNRYYWKRFFLIIRGPKN